MNCEEAKQLRVLCDKNEIWPKLELAVAIWGCCIDKTKVNTGQLVRFREVLLGMLLVEHDKGIPVKLFKDFGQDGVRMYTPLRRAMDFSGVGVDCISDKIRRMTIYPNGMLKVSYKDGKVIWY